MKALLGTLALLAASPTLAWPTSVDVQRSGAVLVVENGAHRIVRIDERGAVHVVAGGLAKPYAVAHAADGTLYVSNGHALDVVRGGRVRAATTAAEDIGPVAVATDGTVFYATSTAVFAFAHGTTRRVAAGLSDVHGLAATRGDAVLVSDTGHRRVRWVGLRRPALHVAQPRGIDVAPDGTIYVVDAQAKRIARFTPAGKADGFVGPRFGDPYDVAVAGASLYVVDTAAAGTVRRVNR